MKEQGQKLVAAGAAMAIAEPVMHLANFGGPGVIAGLAAGLVVYMAVDEIHKAKQAAGVGISSPAVGTEEPSADAKPSLAHRLMVGKSERGVPARGDELAQPRRKSSEIFLFSDVLRSFTPSLEKIYIGTLQSGEHLFCRAKHLCHVALAGPTRGGKSSLMRMLLAQLCHAGASVLILNPHYSRYVLKDEGDYEDQDWTPFDPYLIYDPMECRKYDVIEFYLRQVATELLPKRLEKFAHSQPVGKPYFIAIDELPAIIDAIPDAPALMAKILREGAKVGLFLITASHDFLVKTISPNVSSSAVRECYRSAFYAGGDATTAKILLDMPANLLPEDELGKSTITLRNWVVCQKAALASVALLDNAALYTTLLGPSTYTPGASYGEAEEDALVSSLVSPATNEEHAPIRASATSGPRTSEVTPTLRHHAQSSYDAYKASKTARRPAVYATREQQAPAMPRSEQAESGLKDDERQVLAAYRAGSRSGNAIAALTTISGTRVNQCLNKLSALKLIDWQPKTKL